MGFIFGLMLGSMVSGGAPNVPPVLGSIPFRCLAAFEISDAEYRQCRTVSLRREIYDNTPCRSEEMANPSHPCSMDKAIAWELSGLREMKRAMEQKQAAR